MKKLLFAIFIAFIGIINVNASTNTYNRTSSNLGVNKAIALTPERRQEVLNTPLVDADEKVYDFAEILTYEEELKLYSEINKYVDLSQMDMVILTTDLQTSDYGIENYAANFYDYNDFGLDFENYSGILLIINMNDYNRFYNIYTFGNALLYYNDYRLENMLDSMYSDMSYHNFYGAIHNFIGNSQNYYNQGIPNTNKGAYIDESGDIVYPFRIPLGLAFIISSIVTSITMVVLINRNKMVKKATQAAEYLDNDSVKLNINTDQFIGSHTTKRVIPRSSSSSGGGGGFSSSSRGSSGRSHGGGSGRHF